MLTKVSATRFIYKTESKMVEFELSGGTLHYIDGPIEETARSHEAMGGSQKLDSFLHKPFPWIDKYPGLHQLVCQQVLKVM